MKNLLLPALIFVLTNTPFYYCQTVNLGGIEFSIGDSLNEVISKIDTNYYKFSLLKEEKMEQLGLLFEKNKINSGNYLIGVLIFFIYPFDSTLTPQDRIIDKYLNIDDQYHQPKLISIKKFWADETSNIIDVMIKFYDILDKYGIDKFAYDLDYEKGIEPDGTNYNIYIKTSNWHEIEFFFYKNSF